MMANVSGHHKYENEAIQWPGRVHLQGVHNDTLYGFWCFPDQAVDVGSKNVTVCFDELSTYDYGLWMLEQSIVIA